MTPEISKSPEPSGRHKPKRILRWAGNLIVVSISILIALSLSELIVRQLHLLDRVELLDEHRKTIYQPHPDLGYALRPNVKTIFQRLEFSVTVQTNSDGYRDDEFERDPSEVVIVGLGDSFAWGHGVEEKESFYEIAEHNLAKETPGVHIHNLAVSGYSQLQQRHQIELAKELGADIVVIAVCISNDVLENGGIIRRELNDKNERRNHFIKRDIRMGKNKVDESWLYRKSQLYVFLKSRLNLLDKRLDVSSTAWFEFDQLRHEPAQETKQALKKTIEYLDEIKTQCDESNIKLVLMSIPMNYNVTPSVFEQTLAFYELSGQEFTPDRVTRFYESWCERNNVPILDGSTSLTRTRTDASTYYYPHDRHFNKKGHLVTGEALAEFLNEIIKN